MEIILIANYISDRQESMLRFSSMLAESYRQKGLKVKIMRPTVLFGLPFSSTNSGLGKWFGYVDKWILFPFCLLFRRIFLEKKDLRFHICDHSNSPYICYLPQNITCITCHDVLAIRGALGHANAYSPATITGKLLQRCILYYLSKAKYIASVSQNSLKELKEITPFAAMDQKDWRVIYNGFNAKFKVLNDKMINTLLCEAGLSSDTSFILHVGSGHLRKNRKLLIDMLAALGNEWKGIICYAGEAVNESLLEYAQSCNLRERIVSIVKPNHDTLTALYNNCEAFIFPSLSEGFGWPIIEAQACGAPVITSNIEPMPEISGKGAMHADPHKPKQFADAFKLLGIKTVRQELIRQGYNNIKRFKESDMIDCYLDLQNIKLKNN